MDGIQDSGRQLDDGQPWHEGELDLQARAGTRDRMARIGPRNIRAFMPDQHRTFFAQLPFLVVGSVDRLGHVWASILSGPPGFLDSPDPRRLRIAARPFAGDPLAETLGLGTPLGLLGIELPTKRRNRVNGRVTAIDEQGFTVTVDQSFGNCAQYIRVRDYAPHVSATATAVPRVEPFTALDARARELITGAETLFVATAARAAGPVASQGTDVSHRGGPPGFVRLGEDGVVTVPDYRGNGFFNTLGNLSINPKAGLLFIDFARGDLLQITGLAEIVWDGDAVRAFEGAERLWRVVPLHGRWLRGAFRFF